MSLPGTTGAHRTASLEATIVGATAADDPLRRLAAGSQVGRYIVLGRLGSGAMGDVVAAYDPKLDRKVAIKLLRVSFSAEPSTGPARLLREAQALARLNHPNVVAIHDVATFDGDVCIAMEFVRGQTLAHWIVERDPSWQEVVAVYLQAGRGLAAAHDADLVHRDFKPHNAMIGDDGRVRVMDFGLARSAEGETGASAVVEVHASHSQHAVGILSVELTGHDEAIGTPAYMAPEQHAGHKPDARADQFAFCVALYEALYRQRPFGGETRHEIAAAAMQGDVRLPPTRFGVPAWLRTVVLRGLAVHPEDRYPSMRALLAALDRSPTRWRQRALFVTVPLVLVGAGLGGRWMLRQRALAGCERDSTALAEHWDDGVRQQARAALLATELPYAAAAVETIEARTTAIVDEWSTASRAVCVHVRVDEDWPAERGELAGQCLAQELRRISAFVDVLRDADALVAERAVTSVYDVRSPSMCADPAELLHRTNLLRVGGDQEDVAEELERLDMADALVRAGRTARGRAIFDEVLERAEVLDSDLLRARASNARATAARGAGDPTAAATDYEESYFAATRLGYDELSVASATRLAATLGSDLARFDDAQRWARQADAILTRLGIDDGLMRADLASAVGQIARRRGDYPRAVAELERAVAVFRERLGADHPSVAQALDDLGTAFFEQGRFAEAFEHLDAVLAIRRATYGDAHPIVASSHNDLGVACLQRGDLDLAESHLRRAIEIREQAYGEDSPRIAGSLSNLAEVEYERGEYEGTIALLERARRIREAKLGAEDPDLAQVLSNLAGAHAKLKHWDEARHVYEQALAIQHRALGEEHAQTAYVLLGIGELDLADGDVRRALVHFERALAVREAGKVAPSLVAEARFTLARAHAEAGDRRRAVRLAEQARDELATSGEPSGQLEVIDAWLAANARAQ